MKQLLIRLRERAADKHLVTLSIAFDERGIVYTMGMDEVMCDKGHMHCDSKLTHVDDEGNKLTFSFVTNWPFSMVALDIQATPPEELPSFQAALFKHMYSRRYEFHKKLIHQKVEELANHMMLQNLENTLDLD